MPNDKGDRCRAQWRPLSPGAWLPGIQSADWLAAVFIAMFPTDRFGNGNWLHGRGISGTPHYHTREGGGNRRVRRSRCMWHPLRSARTDRLRRAPDRTERVGTVCPRF